MDFMAPTDWRKPKLAELKAAGGKIIVYHGASDGAFSIQATIDWFEKLRANNGGDASGFARFYSVPSMNHCSGGPATDRFDLFSVLVDWVEHKKAPGVVTAEARANNLSCRRTGVKRARGRSANGRRSRAIAAPAISNPRRASDANRRRVPARSLGLAWTAICFAQTIAGAPPPPPRVVQDAPLMVLSPKAKPPGWTGVHKPHTKLADVLARHKGQADWAETIVDDESLNAQWISMGPGRRRRGA